MRFLADESCDFTVVRALRAAGYSVATVTDLAPGAPDERVIGLAVGERSVLLTEDRDFGRLVDAQGATSSGVLYLRFPTTAREDLGEAVVKLVERMGDRLIGRFVVLQPGRARITG